MNLSRLIFISNLWLLETNSKGQKTYHQHRQFPAFSLIYCEGLHKLVKYMVTTIVSQIKISKNTINNRWSHLLLVLWFIVLLPLLLPTWKVDICQKSGLEKADDSRILKKSVRRNSCPIKDGFREVNLLTLWMLARPGFTFVEKTW